MAVSTAKSFSRKGSRTRAPYSVGHAGTVAALDLGRHPPDGGGYFNTAAASAAPAVGCYPPCLITREQVRRRPPSGLGLEIHVSQRLTVIVADDEAASVVLFDIPGRGEAAIGHAAKLARPASHRQDEKRT